MLEAKIREMNWEEAGECITGELAREYVESISPLESGVFNKFLESEENFRLVAEMVLGIVLPPGEIKMADGVPFLSVSGKKIRIDAFRKTSGGSRDLEAQRITQGFSSKRHLLYGCMAYSTPLKQSRSHSELQPTISIVIYEDNSYTDVIEEASLEGSLLHPSEELLKLVAVNAAQWRSITSRKLREYLAILSNGVYSGKTADKFLGINTESESFLQLNSLVREAAIEFCFVKANREGDIKMGEVIRSLWTKEMDEAAMKRGIEEGKELGVELGAEIAKLLFKGQPPYRIATMLDVSLSNIETIRTALKM
ncbi:MAG: hypothetical protein FWB75_06265 [Oscillospiraceae bacterium]|nr:hypothetical protein [Oscillospiraceae bacterium]